MAAKFEFKKNTIITNLDKMTQKVGMTMLMYASTKAVELEAKMKVNRPWTDRTGMAKATLNTKVTQPKQNVIRITLAHGVSYGIWLELANEKNYAIIGPTIQQESPRIVEDIGNLFSKMKV